MTRFSRVILFVDMCLWGGWRRPSCDPTLSFISRPHQIAIMTINAFTKTHTHKYGLRMNNGVFQRKDEFWNIIHKGGGFMGYNSIFNPSNSITSSYQVSYITLLLLGTRATLTETKYRNYRNVIYRHPHLFCWKTAPIVTTDLQIITKIFLWINGIW